MFKKIETVSNIVFVLVLAFVTPGFLAHGYTIIESSSDYWLGGHPLVIQQQVSELQKANEYIASEHVTGAQNEEVFRAIFEEN
ncbi:MAG: hypothetical protein PHH16_00520 [Candidatus Gracilibacteria bacterium]|nr:hypothetical protein [Candidatus Gracilibacteria bacterium]